MDLDDHDDASADTYNDGSCDGDHGSWVYTGVGADGKTPIRWEQDANQSLVNILGKRQ